MRGLRTAAIAISLGCPCSLSAVAAPSLAPPAPNPVAESEAAAIRRRIVERIQATESADARAYSQLVAPEAEFVDDFGVRESALQHVATIGKRGVGRSRYTLDEMRIDLHGDLALVNFHVIEHLRYGPGEILTRYQVGDTYVKRDGRWLILRHTETQVAQVPPAQKVAAETLQDYVGRYEWWPGFVDTITREGDKLFSQGTGDEGKTLNRAASPESFYFAGGPHLVVFARDRQGKVTHYLLHWADGQVTFARRLP